MPEGPASLSALEVPRIIRVLIADDHALVREGVRAVVAAQPDFDVVGEADDGQRAWLRACELQPDILLLDVSLPGMSGPEVTERVRKDCPSVRVLALSVHEERGYVSRMLRAGAAGYVLKRSPSAEVVRAIRAIAGGETYVDPSLAGTLLGAHGLRQARVANVGTEARVGELSTREGEVLRMVAHGHTNKEIGGALDISVKTVETHKANAMTKLGLRTRAAVVRFAIDQGWLAELG